MKKKKKKRKCRKNKIEAKSNRFYVEMTHKKDPAVSYKNRNLNDTDVVAISEAMKIIGSITMIELCMLFAINVQK